ncbi:MAG TPA: ATP-binding protein, partial [Gammaproteobacteria bacterium]|nr:ATP-binding protein [Gammaproteobacteria bacterium]
EGALRDNERRKDEFLATLSHELRNPLAPLRNSVELLRMTAEDEAPTPPILDVMDRQVNHLVRLVDDLLEMSRISRGTLKLRQEHVELAAFVETAIETSVPLIKSAGHDLTIELPDEPLWVDGDPLRLAQILSNLLNNAAKYTEPGGKISLRAERQAAGIAISVRDNGLGLVPEAVPRLFEMFSRGAHTRAHHQGGLGIGLALARRLAEMHGGSIEARSAGLGQGSEFIVRLPLLLEAAQQAPLNVRNPGDATMLDRRILVVDDNVDAAESLGMLLDMLGAEVSVAYSGPEALEAFRRHEAAVVLLDIGMPGMDGYEVAQRLRADFPDQDTTIVALTGWGQEEDRRRAQAAGFDHHLIKPADLAALRKLLASLDGPQHA